MVQKSGDHQLSLLIYPHYLRRFYTSQVVIAGFLNHEQYDIWLEQVDFNRFFERFNSTFMWGALAIL